MWLLFHHSKGTKRVADGRVLTEHCPTCNKVTRLDEVETTEQVGVWFVDVAGDTERGFRCRVCGDVFSLRAETPTPESRARSREPKQIDASAAEREHARVDDDAADERARVNAAERERARIEALAAEQRRRDADRAAKATRIEDELAELKKRMGR